MSHSILCAQGLFLTKKQGNAWLTLGAGGGSVGLAYGWSLSYQTGRNIFSLRNVSTLGEEEFFLSLITDTPPSRLADIALLYGLSTRKEDERGAVGFASISAGVSLVTATTREFLSSSLSDYKEVKQRTIGLAMESQLIWIPMKTWGLGLYGFGNINSERTFFGALLTLQLGKLR